MSPEQSFALHPLAAQDITEIWEYIAVCKLAKFPESAKMAGFA
jgi:hypothetical protein